MPDCAASLRRMGLQDLPYVVRTHLERFPQGFFARLGPGFLARYYRTFLDGPTAVAVVAEVEGEAVGYLTGVLRPPEHRQLLLRYHGPGLTIAACAAMLRRPRVALGFVFTRLPHYARRIGRDLCQSRTPRPATRPEADRRVGPTAVLTHVVVAEPRRRRGLGRRLVDHFLEEADAAGCASAALVTPAEMGAAAFYERIGWIRAGEIDTREGLRLCRYTTALQAHAVDGGGHRAAPAEGA